MPCNTENKFNVCPKWTRGNFLAMLGDNKREAEVVSPVSTMKQAMLEAYDVRDKGEPPAYTIGYLVAKMYRGYLHNSLCLKASN